MWPLILKVKASDKVLNFKTKVKVLNTSSEEQMIVNSTKYMNVTCKDVNQISRDGDDKPVVPARLVHMC